MLTQINVKSLREKTHLSQEELARILGTSWVSVSRWERHVAQPSRQAKARLDRLAQLLERIGSALPAAEIARFLETPHRLLRGCRPAELLDSDYAFHDLLAFVDAAKSGDMA